MQDSVKSPIEDINMICEKLRTSIGFGIMAQTRPCPQSLHIQKFKWLTIIHSLRVEEVEMIAAQWSKINAVVNIKTRNTLLPLYMTKK